MLPPQEAPLIRSYDISPTSALTSPSNTTIYIGNLLPSVTQADLIPLFQSFGYIIEIRMQPDRGFAFVKLDSHENACLAIVNLQGRDLGGRGMKCSWGKDRDTQGGGGGQYQVRSRVSPFGATLTRAATRVPAAAAAATVRTATAAGSSGRGSRSGVAGAVRRTIRSLVRVPHPDGRCPDVATACSSSRCSCTSNRAIASRHLDDWSDRAVPSLVVHPLPMHLPVCDLKFVRVTGVELNGSVLLSRF